MFIGVNELQFVLGSQNLFTEAYEGIKPKKTYIDFSYNA